ncbi:hypothetical protein AAVH_02885 [Aphelenchoides avenae]|nr:hypothetical protein AAVH_02885 [Aphelenchus avenae]
MELRRSRSESEVNMGAEQDSYEKEEAPLDKCGPTDDKDTPTTPNSPPADPSDDGVTKHSRRERFQARANEMAVKLNAGRAKVNDLLWNRRGKDINTSSSYAELAQEADDSDCDADRIPLVEGSRGAHEATEEIKVAITIYRKS